MAQRHGEHVCGECGAATPRWMGRCPGCGAWGSLAPAPEPVASRGGSPLGARPPALASAAELGQEPPLERLPTGFDELDRALGGGLVPGAAVLLGGEPGVGKSTLLLQAADRLAAAVPVLYASAEESLPQLGRRARRLGVRAPGLRLLADSALDRVLAVAAQLEPRVLIVNSVQTVRDAALGAVAGSVAQVRRVADALVETGREAGRATLLVGHVTKDGALAGPKTLEHLVDAVLYFEGDDRCAQRVVRCAKNRFGAIDELGVFEMTAAGLADARDVSARLLAARVSGAPGSAVGAAREGRRTLLVEMQALTADSPLAAPRRNVVGFDAGRTALICAVLERFGGLALGRAEVYVAAVGGVRVTDPAADLAVAMAIASAHVRRAAPADTAWVGELGMCGELREVPGVEARIAEAARLGFARCVVPAARGAGPRGAGDGIAVQAAARIGDALGLIGER